MQWKDHDGAPDEGTVLCMLDEIEDEAGKELVIGEDDTKWPFRMFVVRRGDDAWGYVNTCPTNTFR